jgi:hypothetical protein
MKYYIPIEPKNWFSSMYNAPEFYISEKGKLCLTTCGIDYEVIGLSEFSSWVCVRQ